ncbi:MAG: hypothetical protein ABL907_23950, partial [Hyphomicrobium sp.]
DVAKKGGPYDAALKDRLAAREALVRAREAAAASDQRLALIAELTARLGELDAPERGPQSAARIAALERAIADAAGLRARRDVAAAELATLQLEAEQARRFVLDCETKTARLATLRQTQAEAGVLEAEIKTLANVINADGATPARLQRIVSFETAINLAQAELGHPGAIVDIALLSGGENKITAGGAPVTAATRITVSERLDLVIEGIGTIRVAAADAGKAAAARRRHEDASTSLVQALGEIGAETVEVAREKTEQRRARVEALDVARARLSGLAPRGAMAVDEELTGLKAALASLDMATLQRNAEACELTALEARRALETIMATAADDARFRKLSSDLEAERREASRRVEEARRASEQLERLKGEQAGVDEDGRAGDVEKAGGALQFAEAEVARIEDEIAALKLLSQTLARAVDGVRTRYFEPVARALHPYLAEIFPESALAFRDGFSLEGLTRAGEREDFATLSDGTREQLAVLVRMGFAQVFAARGTPVPLVLDDPLVYSDDQRLAAMCRALVGAGQQFQVIVLTCRETAFQQLAGQRLTLVPWQGG